MLSIIITTINAENLMKCVDSITCKYPIEIIVLDHRGNDGIKQYCDELTEHTSRAYRYMNVGDVSWGQAINIGISNARFDKILIVQDDVVFAWDSIDKLLDSYREDILCPNTQDNKAPNKDIGEGKVVLDTVEDIWRGRVFACFMFNKAFYYSVGPVEEMFYPIYFDDMDYLYRMRLMNKVVTILLDSVVNHTSTDKTGQPHTLNVVPNEAKYIKKWGGKPLEEKWTVPYNGDIK